MTRHSLVVAVLVAAMVPATVGAATPPPVTAPPLPGGAVFDPRPIPSVGAAEDALAEARIAVVTAEERVAAAEAEHARVVNAIEALGGEDRALTERVEAARRRMRVLAVESYIAGGPISAVNYLLDAPSAGDFTWRQFMLRASFDSTREAAVSYDSLREGVDHELLALATAADGATAELEAARVDVLVATQAVAPAEETLAAAQHEDDHRTGRIVVLSGDDGGPRPDESGNAAGPAWGALRWCESGGNYARADSSGMFRGAYQFAVSTWYSMGGEGDPADAPPAEQDYRAQLLYDLLGAKPWPVCGRFLIEADAPRSDPLPGLIDLLPPDEPLAGPGITTPSTSTTSTTSTTVTSSTTTSTVTGPP